MTDFTHVWDWPQWGMVAWMFLSFLSVASDHGKDRVQKTGDDKGKPEKHNAFTFMAKVILLVFVLICGGFFA